MTVTAWLTLVAGFAQNAHAQNTEITKELTSDFAPRLITVSVAENTGGQSFDAGFGFVVGSNETHLFAHVPLHVVTDQKTTLTQDGQPKTETVPLRIKSVTGHGTNQDVQFKPNIELIFDPADTNSDIAFIKFPKPTEFVSTHPRTASDEQIFRGTRLNYFGHRFSALPNILGQGILDDDCNKDTLSICTLVVRGLVSQGGDSGAVVYTREGALAGFLQGKSSAQQFIRAVRVDEVEIKANQLDVPWQLYVASEHQRLVAQLNDAITTNSTSEIEFLLSKNFDLNETTEFEVGDANYGMRPPVFAAGFSKNVELVKKLISLGSTDVSSALFFLLSEEDAFQAIELSLTEGARIGCTLNNAIKKNNERAIDAVISFAEINPGHVNLDSDCGQYEPPPLYEAILQQNEAVALRLIAAGADVNAKRVDRVFTRGNALTLAILNRQDAVVGAMLANEEIDVTVANNASPRSDYPYPLQRIQTIAPIHAAAYVGDHKMIDALVRLGANPDRDKTEVHSHDGSMVLRRGEGSPVDAAIYGERLDTARYLTSTYFSFPLGKVGSDSSALLQKMRQTTFGEFSQSYINEVESYLSGPWDDYCSSVSEANYPIPEDYFLVDRLC